MQVVPPLLKLIPPSVPGEVGSPVIDRPRSRIGFIIGADCVVVRVLGIWVAQ